MSSALLLARRFAALVDETDPLVQPTDDEINELERALKLRIPSALRAYFLAMGRYGGTRLVGTTTSFDQVTIMTRDARTTMERWKQPLPDDAIVFVSHQGYDFLFVRTKEGANPPVYRWVEGDPIKRAYKTLLEYVESLFPDI